MVTKSQLEAYRRGEREVKELRARMRQAELAASDSAWDEDKRRALESAARYEAIADERADELERIDIEIDALENVDQRRAVRMRYVDGMTAVAISCKMGISERSVYYLINDAVNELEGK